jgi:phosphoglycerate dehydrogenase-like enzyme
VGDGGLTILVPAALGLDRRPGLVDYEADPREQPMDDVGFYVPTYMGARSSLAATEHMPSLQVMQLLTAGFDTAVPYLPSGAVLCNAAGVHDASTAELAVALTLASLRGIDDFARAMPQGEWLRGRRPALADRRVLILGAGGVGQAIKRRFEVFETEIVMVGRTARAGIRGFDELPGLLDSADVVVLALPLNAETSRLVDETFLRRMRPGALLVNVARGGVVDTEALLRHVSDGRITAALDVTDPEPLPADHPLWRTPGVLISPHVGGNSSAFLPRARRLVDEQLDRWRSGSPVLHVVAGGVD